MTTKTSLRALALVLALLAAPAWSATFWVGSSAACTGSNVHGSLGAALLAAAFNGSQSDEIRLTNTLSYTSTGGQVTLTDWSSSSVGTLTLAGGYPDCFTSPSGRTSFGDGTTTSVTVETSSQSESVVTLRRLNINGAGTGLHATGGAVVTLDDVRIGDNDTRGMLVDGGAYVDIQADSIVEHNGGYIYSVNSWGGGLYCNGTGSEVTLSGRLNGNSAQYGGNAYLANGCMMFAVGGAIIEANQLTGPGSAEEGAGVYIDNGGQLFSNGGSNIVLFRNLYSIRGGGLYVNGSGRATLVNTRLVGNFSYVGAAIYAVGGGTGGSAQVTMDRASGCPFVISCSEMEGNNTESSVVYVDNSFVRINRTIIEQNWTWSTEPDFQSLVHGTNGALVYLGHVGMYRNSAADTAIWNDGSEFQIQHATIARNVAYVQNGTPPPSTALLSQAGGANYVHNSIVADSAGFDLQSGSLTTPCLLLDGPAGDLSSGMYHAGTPQFINAASGDFRQDSTSPGVDMCNANTLFWSSTRDIEYQTLPVNDANNDQGNPGESGGYYDAGFDENHMNVGDDYFTLTAAKSGDGSGTIVSVPLGIACGSDCQEDFFNGTLVELYANGSGGSIFDGWLGCPLPSGNVCYISVTEDATVTATFTNAGDEIFSDRFETAP